MNRPRRVATPWRRLGAALLASAALTCGTAPPKGDSGIRPFSYDLWDVHCPSGLRVIFERAPGANTAAVAAVVGAGAVDEPAGREGLAHLVEHLTFRTRGPDEAALWPRLWALGASFNANTGLDETTYHEVAPASRLRDLVATEGRRLLAPLEGVDDVTFAVERDVVRNELRERNETHTFGAAYAGAFNAAFAPGHPYHRDIAGTHETLSALTLDDARRFVRAHYRPDNMTMVVVGDMDLAAVEGFVRATLPPALYGDPAHPRPIGRPPVTPAEPPSPPADRTLRRTHAPVTTPELWIAWPLPGGSGAAQKIPALWSTLTLQNFYAGRFDDDDIGHVQLIPWQGVQGSMLICKVALTKGDHPERSLREVVSALPWIGGDEIYLDQRFRQLKLSLLREIAFNAEKVVDRSLERATYAHLTGGASAYGATIEQVKSITADDARAFAERYLTADRARAVFVEPLGDDARPPKPIPAAQDLATAVGQPPLSPDTLRDLAQVRRLDGLQRTTLPNGLEVVVLPHRGASVITATLAFHVDRLSTVSGLADGADQARDLRLEESPGDFGIAYELDIDHDLVRFTTRAGAANLSRALEMLSYGTRSLTVDWPSDKFRDVKAPLLRRHEASPEGRAERAVWRALFRGGPFGAWATVDQIAALKSGAIQDWLDHVVRPANGVLVVVGDVSTDEATAAARDALARLGGAPAAITAPPAIAPAPAAGLETLTGAGAIVTHRPGASQAELDLRCLLPPADARRDAVYDVVADLVASSLQDDLRQRWGATYGVHAFAATMRGGTAVLTIKANVDNGRLAVALGALRTFWRKMTTEGVSADAVRRSREIMSVSRLLAYDTSPTLAGALVERWNQGWDLRTIDEAPAEFASTDVAEVNAALRACADDLVFGLTGDEGVIRAAFAKAAAPPRVSAPPQAIAPPPPAAPAPPASPAP